jgi:hypothetical protein
MSEIQKNNNQPQDPEELSHIPVAKEVDDMQSLELTRQLIASKRPELTPDEQLELAMAMSGHVKMAENQRANNAHLRDQVDGIAE